MAQNNRETGSRFEEQVADFLKKQGFRISRIYRGQIQAHKGCRERTGSD